MIASATKTINATLHRRGLGSFYHPIVSTALADEAKNTVLLSWELGDNLGHIAALHRIACRFSQLGWRCVFALCDLSSAQRYLGTDGFEFFQAPASRQLRRFALPAVSFADELLRVGYSNPAELAGLISGWRALFNAIKPDLLISDTSPTANLAALAQKLPFIAIGNGYSLPPVETPWPAYPRQNKATTATLAAIESKVLRSIHDASQLLGTAPIMKLSELFPVSRSLICSLPELDHYNRTVDGDQYVGSLAVTDQGCDPRWPVVRGPADNCPEPAKIFLYLRADYPLLDKLIHKLSTINVQVVAYINGLTEIQGKRFQHHNIWISSVPIHLDMALSDSNFVICHGGNMTQSVIASGCPVLLLPMHLEQAMFADRVQELGAGIHITPNDEKGLSKALGQLMSDVRYKNAAKKIAERSSIFGTRGSFDRIVSIAISNIAAQKSL